MQKDLEQALSALETDHRWAMPIDLCKCIAGVAVCPRGAEQDETLASSECGRTWAWPAGLSFAGRLRAAALAKD